MVKMVNPVGSEIYGEIGKYRIQEMVNPVRPSVGGLIGDINLHGR